MHSIAAQPQANAAAASTSSSSSPSSSTLPRNRLTNMVNPLRKSSSSKELKKSATATAAHFDTSPPSSASPLYRGLQSPPPPPPPLPPPSGASPFFPDSEHFSNAPSSPSSPGRGAKGRQSAAARYSGSGGTFSRLRGMSGSQSNDSDFIPYRGPISPPPPSSSINTPASSYATSHFAPHLRSSVGSSFAHASSSAATTPPSLAQPVLGLGLVASQSRPTSRDAGDRSNKERTYLAGPLSSTPSGAAAQPSNTLAPAAANPVATVPTVPTPRSTPNMGFGLPVAYDHSAHRDQPIETPSFAHQSYLPALLRAGGSETTSSSKRRTMLPHEYRAAPLPLPLPLPPPPPPPPPPQAPSASKSLSKQHSTSNSLSSSDGDVASSAFGGRTSHSASTSMTSLREPSVVAAAQRPSSRDEANRMLASQQQQPTRPFHEGKTPARLQLAPSSSSSSSRQWREEERRSKMADADEAQWAKVLEKRTGEDQKAVLSPIPGSSPRDGTSFDSPNGAPLRSRMLSAQERAAQLEREQASRSYRLLQQLHLDELEAHDADNSGYLEAKDGCQRVLMPKPSLKQQQQQQQTPLYAFPPKSHEPQAVSLERNRVHTKSAPDMRARVRAQQVLASSLVIPDRDSSLRDRHHRPLFHHRMPPEPPAESLDALGGNEQRRQSRALRSLFDAPPLPTPHLTPSSGREEEWDEPDTPDLATVIAQGQALEEERERWRRQHQRSFGTAEHKRRNPSRQMRTGGSQLGAATNKSAADDADGQRRRVRYAKSSPDLAVDVEKRTRFEEELTSPAPTSFSFLRKSAVCGGGGGGGGGSGATSGQHGRTRSQGDEAGCFSARSGKPRPRANTISTQTRRLSAMPDQSKADTRTLVSDEPFIIARRGDEMPVATLHGGGGRGGSGGGSGGGGGDGSGGKGQYGVAYSSPRPYLGDEEAPQLDTGVAGRQAIDRQSYLLSTPPQNDVSLFPAPSASETRSRRGGQVSTASAFPGSGLGSSYTVAPSFGTSLPAPPPRKMRSSTSSRNEDVPTAGEHLEQRQRQQGQQQPFTTPAFSALENFVSSVAFMTPPLLDTTSSKPGYFAAGSSTTTPAEQERPSTEEEPTDVVSLRRNTDQTIATTTSSSSDSSSYSRKSPSVRELWNTDKDTEEQFSDLFLQRRRPGDATAGASVSTPRQEQGSQHTPPLFEVPPAQRGVPSQNDNSADSAFRTRLASFSATVLNVDDDVEEALAVPTSQRPPLASTLTVRPSRISPTHDERFSAGGESSILDPEMALSVPTTRGGGGGGGGGGSGGSNEGADSSTSSPSSTSRGKSSQHHSQLSAQPTIDRRESASSLFENHYLLRPTNWPTPPPPTPQQQQQQQQQQLQQQLERQGSPSSHHPPSPRQQQQ
ncbi:hypothetical protein FA10DRAFT_300492 [Acaromyces ingoldii]|uniref:Uncharacterized protein n=1 Tax=Acaromyces ingoldii TaxID=215250 RepID=A0A316YV59_9BASI|nr:hypothetical protein FA10DRAFT_300492 [Acaromyces ingoldii]PWN91933.1 hypothetical protein FA10DRAFT_300492 [Acaromyces ingoldii]